MIMCGCVNVYENVCVSVWLHVSVMCAWVYGCVCAMRVQVSTC